MNNEEQIKDNIKRLHEFRKEIDVNINNAKFMREEFEYTKDTPEENILKNPFKREMSIAHTKLQEAKMWVGKCLEQQGSELPKEFRDKAPAKED